MIDRVVERNPLPISIKIDSGKVGGDSAGLAFALSIIEDLTPGELTGGHNVAVTGAIDVDGTVHPIGGVQQKVVAAHKAKAEILLVPSGNLAEAQQKAGDTIRVVGIDTLDDALAVLTSLGGNAPELDRSPK